MARDYPRSRRIAEQVQRDLAGLIRDEVKDPRITGSVTVSEVQVSRDLGHATVYVSVLGADADAVETSVDALNDARGYLRTLLARGMRTRKVPTLRFHRDTAFDRAAHLSALIDEVRPPDREEPSDQ